VGVLKLWKKGTEGIDQKKGNYDERPKLQEGFNRGGYSRGGTMELWT